MGSNPHSPALCRCDQQAVSYRAKQSVLKMFLIFKAPELFIGTYVEISYKYIKSIKPESSIYRHNESIAIMDRPLCGHMSIETPFGDQLLTYIHILHIKIIIKVEYI